MTTKKGTSSSSSKAGNSRSKATNKPQQQQPKSPGAATTAQPPADESEVKTGIDVQPPETVNQTKAKAPTEQQKAPAVDESKALPKGWCRVDVIRLEKEYLHKKDSEGRDLFNLKEDKVLRKGLAIPEDHLAVHAEQEANTLKRFKKQ